MRYVFFVLACVAISLPACRRSETTASSKEATAEEHDHDAQSDHDHDAQSDHDHDGHDHGEAGEKQDSKADAKTASDEDGQTVEIACAKCIYKMKGVEKHTTAAKIDGKTVLVTGKSPDVHETGLCDGPKQATLTGKMEGGKFVATNVTIK